jgi:hypothetical protein
VGPGEGLERAGSSVGRILAKPGSLVKLYRGLTGSARVEQFPKRATWAAKRPVPAIARPFESDCWYRAACRWARFG